MRIKTSYTINSIHVNNQESSREIEVETTVKCQASGRSSAYLPPLFSERL
jgi:hypothetical protein